MLAGPHPRSRSLGGPASPGFPPAGHPNAVAALGTPAGHPNAAAALGTPAPRSSRRRSFLRAFPTDHVIRCRRRADVGDVVQLVRRLKDDRAGTGAAPGAVLECFERSLLHDEQLFVLVLVRRVRRLTALQRRDVDLELVERRRPLADDLPHGAPLVRLRGRRIPVEDGRMDRRLVGRRHRGGASHTACKRRRDRNHRDMHRSHDFPLTPSLRSASSGHPFHSLTNRLPWYRRSAIPIFVVQNPLAVRSRKLLKNTTACSSPGFTASVYAMSSSSCRRSVSEHAANRLSNRFSQRRSTSARPPRIAV